MATIKSFTDLQQSKRLAEFLPLESADMYYNPRPSNEIPYVGNANIALLQVPCWSLAALLSVIPKRIKDYNVLRTDIDENTFAIWYDEIGYGVNNDLPNITTESAVDACVAMIEKLKEQKLL